MRSAGVESEAPPCNLLARNLGSVRRVGSPTVVVKDTLAAFTHLYSRATFAPIVRAASRIMGAAAGVGDLLASDLDFFFVGVGDAGQADRSKLHTPHIDIFELSSMARSAMVSNTQRFLELVCEAARNFVAIRPHDDASERPHKLIEPLKKLEDLLRDYVRRRGPHTPMDLAFLANRRFKALWLDFLASACEEFKKGAGHTFREKMRTHTIATAIRDATGVSSPTKFGSEFYRVLQSRKMQEARFPKGGSRKHRTRHTAVKDEPEGGDLPADEPPILDSPPEQSKAEPARSSERSRGSDDGWRSRGRGGGYGRGRK